MGRRVVSKGLSRVEDRLGPRATAAVEGGLAKVAPGRAGRSLGSRATLAQAVSAFEAGNVEDAKELADRLYARRPDDPEVVRLRLDLLRTLGDVTERARMLHRQNRRDPQPKRQIAEGRLVGRLAETSPGWLPRIPGPARPVEPRPGVVLHLLKESAPELTTGFTMRSRYNLLAARDAGLEPEVVTSLGFPRLLDLTTFDLLVTPDGIPHHRLDLGSHYSLQRPPNEVLEDQAWLTARVARDVRPWMLHVSSGYRGYETALVGLAVRDHVRRPIVYEVRSFFEATWTGDERFSRQGEQYERRFATETRAMLAMDHVITIAETMRRDIIARGVPEDRVSVLPNGVDVAAFEPMAADPALRERYGLADAFVFGYVSNLDHRRENQELLVEATALLRRRGRRVACLIVGDGARRAEVEAIAKKSGAASSVVFTGRVPHDEVRGHYALMDAFVVPRRDERASRTVTPLKPFEALAMERPLIVADLPALTEIAEPEERGLSFRAGDAAHLADQLERLMEDPALARRLGTAGRDWVARERSWAANGDRLREIYAQAEARWAARGGPSVRTGGPA